MFSSMYILHHLICQNLPLLPKPLSILKTAETRTYLSKLIWLGNGGRRPQYGNPDTKPLWWPQHILPWEEMKKMGGRKSVELSNINYTEILKQCLATVRRTNVGIKNIFIYINIFYFTGIRILRLRPRHVLQHRPRPGRVSAAGVLLRDR